MSATRMEPQERRERMRRLSEAAEIRPGEDGRQAEARVAALMGTHEHGRCGACGYEGPAPHRLRCPNCGSAAEWWAK